MSGDNELNSLHKMRSLLCEPEETKNKRRRNQLIRKAVTRYGYNQNEISGHLGMRYSTISNAADSGDTILNYLILAYD